MHGLGLGLGDDLVGLGQLLPIVDALTQRIIIALGGAHPQQVQHDLGIFGVVLIPSVM